MQQKQNEIEAEPSTVKKPNPLNVVNNMTCEVDMPKPQQLSSVTYINQTQQVEPKSRTLKIGHQRKLSKGDSRLKKKDQVKLLCKVSLLEGDKVVNPQVAQSPQVQSQNNRDTYNKKKISVSSS